MDLLFGLVLALASIASGYVFEQEVQHRIRTTIEGTCSALGDKDRVDCELFLMSDDTINGAIALVGTSGAGKSTLANTLAGCQNRKDPNCAAECANEACTGEKVPFRNTNWTHRSSHRLQIFDLPGCGTHRYPLRPPSSWRNGCDWFKARVMCGADALSQGASCSYLTGCNYTRLVNLTDYSAYVLVVTPGRGFDLDIHQELLHWIQDQRKPYYVVVNFKWSDLTTEDCEEECLMAKSKEDMSVLIEDTMFKLGRPRENHTVPANVKVSLDRSRTFGVHARKSEAWEMPLLEEKLLDDLPSLIETRILERFDRFLSQAERDVRRITMVSATVSGAVAGATGFLSIPGVSSPVNTIIDAAMILCMANVYKKPLTTLLAFQVAISVGGATAGAKLLASTKLLSSVGCFLPGYAGPIALARSGLAATTTFAVAEAAKHYLQTGKLNVELQGADAIWEKWLPIVDCVRDSLMNSTLPEVQELAACFARKESKGEL